MKNTITVFVALLIVTFCASELPVSGQAESQQSSRSSKPQEESKQSGNDQPTGIQAYRLDFSFHEMEEGKKINTRHYSMDLTPGPGRDIKIGTRVPVSTSALADSGVKSMQFQYIDVGTSIVSRLERHGDELELVVSSDVSNIDVPSREAPGGIQAPVVRQIKIEGSTLLVLGKPIAIGSMDDPNSKRQFQLEVTVTKLR
jgi:hypothetical protein